MSGSESINVDEWLQQAIALHQSSRLSDAESLYLKILQYAPSQPDALHHLGILCHQKGDSQQAQVLIRQALNVHPIPEMVQNLGLILSAASKKTEAIEVVKFWLEVFPESKSLSLQLGALQTEVGDTSSAANTLRALVENHPNAADAIINLANLERKTGFKQKAKDLYFRALEINKDFSEAHSGLGVLFFETNNLETSIFHNRRAVELSPERAAYHYNLGNSLLAFNRTVEALKCFEVAAELDPDSADIWLNLGAAKRLCYDLQGAMKANYKALSLNLNSAKALINQASILLLLRRYKESLEFLKKGVALDSENYVAWGTMAEAYRQLGRLQEARMAVYRAIKLEPTYGRSALVLASIEEQANCFPDAEKALRQALRGPSDIEFRATDADARVEAGLRLGEILAQSARESEAKVLYKNMLNLLAKQRPGLVPDGTELSACSQKMVLLQPIGRAGSLFLHSLVDGHPEIMTTPAALLKGFFGDGVWEGICPGFDLIDWRVTLVERFIESYRPLLDATSPAPVPGNPLGEPTFVGRGFGLCEMGQSQDQVLVLDENKFKSYLLDKLAKRSSVSAPEFFWLVHQAYDFVLNRPTNKHLLFFHIHNPNVNQLAGCLVGNPNVHFLNIVREPLQAMESWMSSYIVGREEPEQILLGYQDAVERLQLALQQASRLVYDEYPSVVIRLEDIKRRPELAFARLSEWLGVADDHCFRSSTFAGLEYQAPSNVPVKAFETANLDRKSGFFFSEHDQRVMNLLLYPIAVKYGYRTADSEYLSMELNWYKPRVNEPLDFEKAILKRISLVQNEADILGPRRHLNSIAQRCINLLERYGTYPAMAPWLKVE